MTVSPPTDAHNQNALVRFTRAELESYRGAEVPDLVGPATRLLFVGINPGLRTAAIQTHFGKPGNRFWPALHLAGILDEAVDVTDPMTDEVKASLLARGIGISNLVRRATARADELDRPRAARGCRPVGRPGRAGAAAGGRGPGRDGVPDRLRSPTRCRRPATRGDSAAAELWVVPNPSGLNAHETVDSLAAAYAEPARAAGIIG